MRILVKGLLVAVVCLVVCTSTSFARFGLGGFVQGAKGPGELEFDSTSELDVDARHFGLGFVLDTEIGDGSFFNYRLNVGLDAQDLEFEVPLGDLELRGAAIDNNFGFAVLRTPQFRLWVGPQVRLGIYGGQTSVGDFDIYALAFGVGPIVGGNFVLNDRVAFSLSGGARLTGLVGEVDFPFDEEGFGAVTVAGFLNFAVLFGIGR